MPIPLGILAVAGAGAAGGGAAYDLIETVSPTSVSTLTFNNINTLTDYKHLQIRYTSRATAANNSTVFALRINGDTSNNYRSHILRGTGSAVQSVSDFFTSTYFNDIVPMGNNSTGIFGAGVIDILDHNSSNKYKTIRLLMGQAALDNRIALGSAFLTNTTNAITSITIFILSGDGNFATGSRFSLYGIK